MKKFYLIYCLLATTMTIKANLLKDLSDYNIIIEPKAVNIDEDIIYVKKGSIGNGSSWDNAIGELSDALKWLDNNKNRYINKRIKIYISKGIYKPKYTPRDGHKLNENPSDPREKSFLLINNLEIYGGFDPENGIKNENDSRILPNNYKNIKGTILSGDLNDDDIILNENGIINIKNNENNAYHVIINSSENFTNTILDGITISGGYADNSNKIISNTNHISNNEGSAIYNSSRNSSTISLINSEISFNYGSNIYSTSTTNSSTINLIKTSVNNNIGDAIYSYSILNTEINLIGTIISKNITTNDYSSIINCDSTGKDTTINIINSNIISNSSKTLFKFSNIFGINNLNIHNSIIYNNTNEFNKNYTTINEWIKSSYNLEVNYNFKNSQVQGNTDLSNNNLDPNLDPKFKDINIEDYSLLEDSHLIDNGSDILYNLNDNKDIKDNKRLFGKNIDIGAFEFNYLTASDLIKSITRKDISPTNSNYVSYIIEFNENVTGVDKTDFSIFKVSGNVDGEIISISGSGKIYTINIDNLKGEGEIRLDLNDKNTEIKNNNYIDIKGGYFDGEIYFIDTIKPENPTITLSKISDTGYKSDDRLTKNTELVFEGKSEPLTDIIILQDGITIDTIKTNENGIWTITANNFKEGRYIISAQSVDNVGNKSNPSSIEIFVDTTAPTLTKLDIPSNKTYYFNENLTFSYSYNEPILLVDNKKLELNIIIGNKPYILLGKTNDNKKFDFSIKVDNNMFDNSGIIIKGLNNTNNIQDLAGNIVQLNEMNKDITTNILIDNRNTDLDINTTISNSTPNVGDQISIIIKATNYGSHDAENVNINTIIPEGLKLINVTSDNIKHDFIDNKWSVNLDRLHINSSKVFTLLVEIIESKELIIESKIETKTIDINPSNNTNIVTIFSNKKDQAIIWDQNLTTGCENVNSIKLLATSTSGLPILYTSSDESVAKIINNELVILRLGYVKITAHLYGNSEFSTATSITKDLTQSINGLIKTKFDDTVYVDNSSSNFISWQWFKNGEKIYGANDQFYNDPDKLNGKYHVEVKTTNGFIFETCPVQLYSNKNIQEIYAIPNPTIKNSSIKFLINHTESELKNSKLVISDLTGRIIYETNNITKETSIKSPSSSGIFIVNLYLENGKNNSTKIIVN